MIVISRECRHVFNLLYILEFILLQTSFHSSPQSNGRFQLNIPAEMYRQMVRYRYDPFCVKSTIAIVAEVEEAGRGTKAADTHRFSLVASPVDVKFADDNPKVFRPGLNYTVKVSWYYK